MTALNLKGTSQDFEDVRKEVEHIAKIFDESEHVIHKGRNTLEIVLLGSLEVMIKRFSAPTFFNQESAKETTYRTSERNMGSLVLFLISPFTTNENSSGKNQ